MHIWAMDQEPPEEEQQTVPQHLGGYDGYINSGKISAPDIPHLNICKLFVQALGQRKQAKVQTKSLCLASETALNHAA